MQPQLVILRAIEPGHGLTMVCQDLVVWLRGNGLRVGGFSIVRAYTNANSDVPAAHYVHLYRTDERFRLAHHRVHGDEAIHFEGRRVRRTHYQTQNVSNAATHRALDELRADLADQSLDAVVIDDVGPALAATEHQSNRRAADLPALMRQAVEEPKPVTIVACPEKVLWVDAHDAQNALEDARRHFPGPVFDVEVNAHSLHFISAKLITDLASLSSAPWPTR